MWSKFQSATFYAIQLVRRNWNSAITKTYFKIENELIMYIFLFIKNTPIMAISTDKKSGLYTWIILQNKMNLNLNGKFFLSVFTPQSILNCSRINEILTWRKADWHLNIIAGWSWSCIAKTTGKKKSLALPSSLQQYRRYD